MTTPPEILLASPATEADETFRKLSGWLAPVVAPIPVRVVRGDGGADPPPLPRAALIGEAQAETAVLLRSVPGDPRPGQSSGAEGWSWVHLTSPGPDSFAGWGPLPGNPLRTYSRGVNARTTAEWVLGAILHFRRDFGHYVRSMSAGRWERRRATELEGKTLVVLGAGAVGSEVSRITGALGMRTIGVSRSGAPLPGFDRVVTVEQVDTVWGTADVTVVLLPLTPSTRGSIGAERIVRLKQGSLLIVASRGGIVDEEVVAHAVRTGHLSGAAFDVFEREPLPPDSSLRREPRILLTPHVAGTSDRFMERTAAIVETIWRSWQGGDDATLEAYRYRG